MTTVSELELLIAQRRDEMSWHDMKRELSKLQAERAALRDRLAAAVMNLPYDDPPELTRQERAVYLGGQRDARHRAVETINEILGDE